MISISLPGCVEGYSMSLLKVISASLTSLFLAQSVLGADARILDLTHASRVLGEVRNYRIFLPPGYDRETEKPYPVIYFFHGWGERYNVPTKEGAGGYDSGEEYGGDNIANFVAKNDVIVVKWDGYNPRIPGENNLRPYNIGPVETYRQFPLYFPELVAFIDSHFRTIPDRDHRGVSGLSMGGFMAFWVGGKYPHLVGSVSNFMGSAEFVVGPNGFPSEYSHTDMYRNYEGVRTRLVMGTEDFIRWYHGQMNKVWDYARPNYEHETFKWDHGTPGMAKQLGFHMKAFANPLPKPTMWHHIDVYPTFDVWGYSATSDRHRPGFTALENVTPSGFRCSVREWLWDGQLMPSVNLSVVTDAIYLPNTPYRVTDVNVRTHDVRVEEEKSDAQGRLHIKLDGDLHEVGISESQNRPLLTWAGFSIVGANWAIAGRETELRLRIVNKGTVASGKVTGTLSSTNPNVRISINSVNWPPIGPGAILEGSTPFMFQVQDPACEIASFELALENDSHDRCKVPIEVKLYPDVSFLDGVQVADGRAFRVQARGDQIEEGIFGIGNGDAIANPGESVQVLVKDEGEFRMTSLYTTDPFVNASGLNLRFSDYWGKYDHVGGSAKYSMPTISAGCPPGHEIVFFAEYWLPNAPEHILKRGLVRLKVEGKDQTGPKPRWAEISSWNVLEIQMIEGGAVREARAKLTQIQKPSYDVQVPLNDEGRDGDKVAGDTIFSGTLPDPPEGRYQVTIDAVDESGNRRSDSLEVVKK
jgi:S-formylglutathione hydrolase FrmB